MRPLGSLCCSQGRVVGPKTSPSLRSFFLQQAVAEAITQREQLEKRCAKLTQAVLQLRQLLSQAQQAAADAQEFAYATAILQANKALVARRDLEGLSRLRDLPPKLLELVDEVRRKKSLHAQFWRYIESFASGYARGPRRRPSEVWTPGVERRATEIMNAHVLQENWL